MVQHALPEFGEHVLQHRGTRADQVHPVVAEIAPDERLRAQGQRVERLAGLCQLRHMQQCYKFRTLYQVLVIGLTHTIARCPWRPARWICPRATSGESS